MKIFFFSLLFLWGCYGSNPQEPQGNPGPNEIWILDNRFEPQTLTVQDSTTVTWIHKGNKTHTVTQGTSCSQSGFNSGNLSNGQTFQHFFSSTGNVPYFCIHHCGPGMTGTIQVQ